MNHAMQCCLGEVAESTPKIMAFTLMSGVADYVIFLTTLDGVIFWLVMIISLVTVTKIFLLTVNFLIAVESATNPRRLCHGMAFSLAHYVGPVTMPIAFPKGFHHSMVHNVRGWSVW